MPPDPPRRREQMTIYWYHRLLYNSNLLATSVVIETPEQMTGMTQACEH